MKLFDCWREVILLPRIAAGCCIATALAAQAQIPGQFETVARQSEAARQAMSASLESQKASVRRQHSASTASTETSAADPSESPFFVLEHSPLASSPAADCDPLSAMEVQSLSDRAAKANNLNPDFVRAVMKSESGFRPCAVSAAGALGLMQLMPATASELEVSEPLNPEQNVFAGAKLLRRLMDRFSGDLNRTLGAYNAGPANVDKYNGVPNFPETLTYVDKTMKEFLSHTAAND